MGAEETFCWGGARYYRDLSIFPGRSRSWGRTSRRLYGSIYLPWEVHCWGGAGDYTDLSIFPGRSIVGGGGNMFFGAEPEIVQIILSSLGGALLGPEKTFCWGGAIDYKYISILPGRRNIFFGRNRRLYGFFIFLYWVEQIWGAEETFCLGGAIDYIDLSIFYLTWAEQMLGAAKICFRSVAMDLAIHLKVGGVNTSC